MWHKSAYHLLEDAAGATTSLYQLHAPGLLSSKLILCGDFSSFLALVASKFDVVPSAVSGDASFRSGGSQRVPQPRHSKSSSKSKSSSSNSSSKSKSSSNSSKNKSKSSSKNKSNSSSSSSSSSSRVTGRAASHFQMSGPRLPSEPEPFCMPCLSNSVPSLTKFKQTKK
ncbi:hypothetical protein FHG87_018027 [Trinorchestia longiramus]|nr:hypothetical protein FHG87_018027 [Trinorchestia longiramus]